MITTPDRRINYCSIHIAFLVLNFVWYLFNQLKSEVNCTITKKEFFSVGISFLQFNLVSIQFNFIEG